jgi:hypothetical protein
MNDIQEQAKNFLRNVVKQNPDKIKAGVEKAGDLVDKQTSGKYAEKVDAVQEKADNYIDSHADKAEPPADDFAADESTEEAGDAVVGGTPPEVAEQPSSSAGSDTKGLEPGGTATGTSDGDLPRPR